MAADGRIVIDVELNDGSVVQGTADITQQLNQLGDDSDGVFKKLGKGFKNLAKAAAIGVGAIAGIGTAAVLAAAQFDNANGKIKAALGTTEAEAKALGETAKNVWKQGFGESVEEVTDALIRVKQNMQNLDDGEVERVTKNALGLAKTFDSDVNEVTRAANNLMTNFGIDSEKAFDMMAKGAQNGLNFSNEMFDNLAEYAPLWSDMGYSAEEMFGILERGAKEGVYSLDYMNDVMKEFQIRATDGSKSTTEAVAALGPEVQKVWTAFSKGEATVADMANVATVELDKITDKVKQNEMGVALFGTKWEDLGGDVVLSMLASGGAMSDFEGAMGGVLEAQEQTFGQRWSALTRSASTALVPLGNVLLSLAETLLPKVIEVIDGVSKLFADIAPSVKKAMDPIVEYVKAAVDALKNVWEENGASFIDSVKDTFASIRETVIPILEGVFDTIKNVIGNVKNVWEQDGQAILERLTSIFNKIKDIVQPIIEDAVQLIVDTFAKVKEFWDANGQQILQAISNVFQGILAVIEFIMPAVKFIIDYVWTAIKNIFTGALDAIMGAVKIFTGLFTGDWSKMWEGAKQLFVGAVNFILGWMSLTFLGGIRTALVNLGKAGISIIKGMWDDIAKLFINAGSTISNLVSKMATAVVNYFKNIWTQGSNIFGTLRTFGANTFNALKQAVSTTVSGMVSGVVNYIKNMFTNFVNLISNLKTSVVNKFTEIKNGIVNKVKEVNLVQVGKDIVSGLINGIGSMASAVVDKVKGLANSITSTAKAALGIHSPSRVFKEIGLWTGEGLAIGLNSSSKMVNEAMSDIGDGILAVSDAYQQEYLDLIDEFNRKNEDKNDATLEKIYKIRNAAAKKKRKLTKKELQDIALLEAQYKDAKLQAEKDFDKKYLALVEKSEKEYLDVIKSYIDDKKSLDELSLVQEAAVWEQSIELFVEGSKERITAQQNYKKAVEAVNKEVVAINKQYQDEMQRINDDLIAKENELTKAYQDAVSTRKSSLMSFASTFEEFKVEITQSGTELLANLQSQVDGFKLWKSEFAKLSSRGIDAELLDELSELGVKALPQLLELNQLTDAQLTQYSDLYREKSGLARKQAEKELQGMKADTDKQIKELRSVADKQLTALKNEWISKIQELTTTTSSELSSLEQVGKDAGQGLLNGLTSMEGPLAAKAKQIANSIKSSIQQALDIHSPSRWMRDFVAGNLAKGFEVGVDKNEGMLKNAAVQIGEFIKPTIVNPLRGAKLNLGLDKPSASTSNISNIYNNNNYGNGGVPTIEPAPVILDEQKIGEVVFNTVTRKQAGSNALTAYMRGV